MSDCFDVSVFYMVVDEGYVDCVVMLLENDAMCNNGIKYLKYGLYIGKNWVMFLWFVLDELRR